MKELMKALIKAQSEFNPVKKTETNPFYNSTYANLDTVIEATKPALINNGLAVIQTFCVIEGKQALKTSLIHLSGEVIEGNQIIDCKDNLDPQKVGSASTYARRYGYMAILGLAPEDDDANNATKPAPAHEKKEHIPIKNPAKDVDPVEVMTITQSLDSPAGTVIGRITGRLKEAKQNDTKTGKARTYYTIQDDEGVEIVVMEWAKINSALVEGIIVDALGVAVSEYNSKKQFTCKSIGISENEIPFN